MGLVLIVNIYANKDIETLQNNECVFLHWCWYSTRGYKKFMGNNVVSFELQRVAAAFRLKT